MITDTAVVRAGKIGDFNDKLEEAVLTMYKHGVTDIQIQFHPLVIPDPDEVIIVYTAFLVGRRKDNERSQ